MKKLVPIVGYVVAAVTVIGMGGCGSGSDSNDESEQVSVEQPSLLELGVIGCYHPSFAGAQSSQFGCGILSTTGNVVFDRMLIEEIEIQRNFFVDYRSTIHVFDECNADRKNAYASQSGLVMLGWYFMQDLLSQRGSALPIAGVLAHEMGHRLQFENGWMIQTEPTVRRTELEADMWSGLYMALVKTYSGSEIETYWDAVYDLGDYNFHHPTHHGTKLQRLAAVAVGYDVALLILQGRHSTSSVFCTKCFCKRSIGLSQPWQ